MSERPKGLSELYTVVVVVYVAATLFVSYALWARDGAIWVDNPDTGFSWVFGGLVLLHLAVGAIVGRWWIVGLPLVWLVLSLGAISPDGTPVGVELIFTSPFIWMPLLFVGVASRKLLSAARRVSRSS
jgi:hypothetical protein